MPPKGRKLCRLSPPDFLSNLPDNVIDVILMCLPCKDAVRTSILSKKWRYNWCRLTELKLDRYLWTTKKDLLNPTVKFTKIIYQLLSLHEGPITKFTLDIPYLNSFLEIGNFLYFLSRNGIQHLVLRLPLLRPDGLCSLPSSVFTCLQLRHLTVHNWLIHPPSAFQGFDWLTSLELSYVTMSSESLGSLISHCPLLEQLVLKLSEISSMIEINAPMLRSFDFTGDISYICLKNVLLLAKASLTGKGDMAEKLDFAKVFESCSALEHLLLDLIAAEFFDADEDEAPTRLPFDINSVKRFYLPNIPGWKSFGLSCALCLIRSFPSLEYLEIKVYPDEADDGGGSVIESLELEHFSDVTFNHLREVKLQRFDGTVPEMQIIKLLLAKSPVLVRMLIDRVYLDHKPLDTGLEIFAEVSNFPWASPNAEIVYCIT